MQVRRSFGAAVVAFSLVAAAGCSSSGSKANATVPLAQWSTQVCKPLTTWLTGVQGASDQSQGASNASPAEKKSTLVTLFATTSTSTDTLVSALGTLPSPDLANGSQVNADLTKIFTDFKSQAASARDKIAAASTSDAAAFDSTSKAAVDTFQKQVSGIGPALNGLATRYPGLKQSLDAACKTEQPTTTESTTTSTTTPDTTTSSPTPTSSAFHDGIVDAGLFTVTSTFTGASQWTVSAVGSTTDPTKEATIQIRHGAAGSGPTIVIEGPVPNDTSKTLAEAGVAYTQGLTVVSGPTPLVVGTEPALGYVYGTSVGPLTDIIVVRHNGGTYLLKLQEVPKDSLATYSPVLTALADSLKFSS